MQNLGRVGKNDDPIISRLWIKVHDILRRCSEPLVVCNAFARLCIGYIMFRSKDRPIAQAVEIAVKLRNRR